MTVIAVVVGNPHPASRTATVAEEVATQVAARLRGRAETGPAGTGPSATSSEVTVLPTVDLAAWIDRVFTLPEPDLDALTAQVAAADLVVVASPTYKAAYTGLLKAFLDRYGTGGLSRVTAVPLLTIGSPAHTLAVEHTLRPLLVELGASVPTRGIAFLAAQTDDRARVIGAWLDAEWPHLEPLLTH